MRNAAERQQLIQDRKRPIQNEDASPRKHRLWVRNAWRACDVFDVPVDAVVLNADNRRFRAERLWAEEVLGRALDPENYPDDERTIESLLLDTSHHVDGTRIVGSPTDDYKALKNDWLRRGQESPFWIRPDGTVRNGNRRLAMIKRLQREGGDVGLQWVQAVLLDAADIDEPALLEMEQREQLTENLKVRYNDIDYLLALREAAVNRDIDWFDGESIDNVAGELQTMVEKSKGEVIRDLYAIKYMDQFLEDSRQPGRYHRLLRTLERFRDIGRMMFRAEEEYPLEADRILQVLFAAVRSGQTHNDIRAIRRMFRRDRHKAWLITARPSLLGCLDIRGELIEALSLLPQRYRRRKTKRRMTIAKVPGPKCPTTPRLRSPARSRLRSMGSWRLARQTSSGSFGKSETASMCSVIETDSAKDSVRGTPQPRRSERSSKR